MSWNAHTDHIFNQLPGQLKELQLCGPDGVKWGSSGTNFISDTDSTALKGASNSAITLKGVKYMFLREPDDNMYIYNKSGQGLAVYKGKQYVAVGVAADGYKAEQCVTALEKLKAYLSGIGYN